MAMTKPPMSASYFATAYGASPTIPTAPEEWIKAAHELLTYLPASATIAGGMLRDIEAGVEPKDIDIFVHKETLKDWTKPVQLNWKLRELPVPSGYKNHYIEEVYSGTHDGFLINVIVIKNISCSQYVEKVFDINLCKVMMSLRDDGTLRIQKFPEYVKDVENKTITIKPTKENQTSIGSSIMKHLPRIQAKFPEYTPRVEGVN